MVIIILILKVFPENAVDQTSLALMLSFPLNIDTKYDISGMFYTFLYICSCVKKVFTSAYMEQFVIDHTYISHLNRNKL